MRAVRASQPASQHTVASDAVRVCVLWQGETTGAAHWATTRGEAMVSKKRRLPALTGEVGAAGSASEADSEDASPGAGTKASAYETLVHLVTAGRPPPNVSRQEPVTQTTPDKQVHKSLPFRGGKY